MTASATVASGDALSSPAGASSHSYRSPVNVNGPGTTTTAFVSKQRYAGGADVSRESALTN
ncbi:hypothetical protein [Streptomyces sp. CA-111067]|uniref:hypothetical protein n=1 Tax=Streptomyces sp. CA-111067 TaxID=3240046 RepID=UPI003D991BEA